jgi:DHA1 family bicyclomycin/chloramphenicol resistance-like MFS transporter
MMRLHLRPGTAAMTLLLAALTSLGPLSTDMYLPSLPWIAQHFEASEARTQLTLSVFLVGFAAGQLFYGPVSDRFGRKPVLLCGLAIFAGATVLCYASPSIDALIAARFGQALGACAGVVLARAIVRDLYGGAQAARLLSIMGALMGLVPAIAPIGGGVLQEALGWRSVFAAMTVFAVVMLVAVAVSLPETNQRRGEQALTFGSMLRSFAALLAAADFRHYALTAAASYGGLFAFISGSSFVFQGHYGLDASAFSFVFAAAVVGYIAGTLIGARATVRAGIDRTLWLGSVLLALGGGAMAALVLLSPRGHFLHVLVPMIVYMAGVGLTLPQSMAGALTPYPERAGAASSLLGACQMTFGATVGVVVGHNLAYGPATLAVTIAVLGAGCAAVAWRRRGRLARS